MPSTYELLIADSRNYGSLRAMEAMKPLIDEMDANVTRITVVETVVGPTGNV